MLQNIVCKRHYLVYTALTGVCVILLLFDTAAQKNTKPPPPLSYAEGKLKYVPDSLGNRIPDFSFCGYKAGEQAIPDAPVKVVVPVAAGDATWRIQSAIDHVSKLPADRNGLRGTVLLQKGVYRVDGSLLLHTSGVVLRGAGFGENGTIVTGAGKDRETLIRITGEQDQLLGEPVPVTGPYVPVNANTIHVSRTAIFKAGDLISIIRPSIKEWIAALGTDHFGGGITSLGWKPGQRDIEWIRTVTAVNGNAITIDAPLTTALDANYGGGKVSVVNWPGRIENCGIENLQLVSSYDTTNAKDEDHRWMAITIDNARDAWVRQVSFKYFAGSAVAVYEQASRVTVEDCSSSQPVSEIGGERRNTFFTAGQQTLFRRCYAEYGMHDFATGFCAAGPNAFVQCESQLPFGFSGGLDSWASGVLFDLVNVDGNAISFFNRGQDGQGAGWNVANGVLWNCSAARIDCYQPPGAQNWAFGSWSQFGGDGYWGESNNSMEPRSLYHAQLKERIAATANTATQVMNIGTSASSSPSVETAASLSQLTRSPAKTLQEFIREAPSRQPIPVDANGAKTIDEIGIPSQMQPTALPALHVENGWLVRDHQIVTGSRMNVPWWNGSAKRYATKNAAMAITRFVPGRTGKGLTDDLNALTDSMIAKKVVAIDHNYGLWYDRRRDDHERIRRMDGDVWTPFYELPFARSGKETAWDGLSKYDLTRYNHWYWSRLQQFADLADRKGLLLIQQHYFQHNIIEAGAHYADFPWRPANNINHTGFPEPPMYAGDKRIFMDEPFYDTTHPVRRALHKKFIRQCLDNFSNNNSMIHFTGEEYTGPLHFVQFWLNTIDEWEREKGKKQLIGLSATRDVQDAILNDPRYAALIDVIDIKYWYYQADGTAYAPQGGQHLAPRQHARLLKPRSSAPQQVYRAVLEYKRRFPAKAVIYTADGWDKYGWAVAMAGGSLSNITITNNRFLKEISTMQPVLTDTTARQWVLHNPQTGYVIDDWSDGPVTVDLSTGKGSYRVSWVNTLNGDVKETRQTVKGGKRLTVPKPEKGNWILWLQKQ